MAPNAVYFRKELKKAASKLSAGAYRQFRDKLVFDGLAMIDESWPVDTGFSRASNLPFVDAGVGSLTVPDPDPEDYPAGSTPSVQRGEMDGEKWDMAQLVLDGSGPFDNVGISTNCIYAPPLERGHSDQSSFMYTRTASAIDRVVASARDFSEGGL